MMAPRDLILDTSLSPIARAVGIWLHAQERPVTTAEVAEGLALGFVTAELALAELLLGGHLPEEHDTLPETLASLEDVQGMTRAQLTMNSAAGDL